MKRLVPLKNNIINSSKTHSIEEEKDIAVRDTIDVHIAGDLFRVIEVEDNIGPLDQQEQLHSDHPPPTANGKISLIVILAAEKTTLPEIVRKTSKCLCDRT